MAPIFRLRAEPVPRRSAVARWLFFLVAAVVTTLSVSGAAAPFEGVVVDGWTGTPVEGARVVAAGRGAYATTDATGAFRFDVDDDEGAFDVVVEEYPGQSEEAVHRWTGMRADRPRVLTILSEGVDADADAGPAWSWGRPLPTRPDDGVAQGPITLPVGPGGPLFATVGAELPATIRVGRRFASSCSGNAVQRIDTVPLEEYVEGVLIPEIAVFKRIAGGPESSRAVFEAFAIAARSYAYWFYLRNPGADFHIDDTACNQRYEEQRDAFIREAVRATAGQILVRASATTTIDKYEYAASCGREGSRPAYQTSLVPDITGQNACVGSWCGHNGCAAHEVNPAVPDRGRCLVRGICQWGAAERSMRGDSARQILSHYQPNLSVITLGAPGPAEPAGARLVGFVRVGDIQAGPGVEGVRVSVTSGQSAMTRADGFFELLGVPTGPTVVRYEGGGIVEATAERTIQAGVTNWASLAATLAEVPEPEPEPGPEPEPEPEPADPDAGVADAGGIEDASGGDVGVDTAGEGDDTAPDSRPADAGVEDGSPTTADTGGVRNPEPDGVEETPRRPGRDEGDASAVGGAPPGYSVVPEGGLGDTGCACSSSAYAPGASGALWLLVIGCARGRRRRTGASMNEGR